MGHPGFPNWLSSKFNQLGVLDWVIEMRKNGGDEKTNNTRSCLYGTCMSTIQIYFYLIIEFDNLYSILIMLSLPYCTILK